MRPPVLATAKAQRDLVMFGRAQEIEKDRGLIIDAALRRARKLHGWTGRKLMLIALLCEVGELAYEILRGNAPEQLIRSEAVDVAVVAIRIGEGK